ncbi:hypothetical protein [Methylobacterium oxalidis]|uniref:Uncharacterized protein n=1 Tax=Methylobacterium oxalidis TaxID=944322 RepID=A0A512JCF8_9HYPH|nr:hypothetical protein [Methylobacterium oxalidis]GEP07609.1 hypothetical protein MOX02_56470 [Methylobacterium oxalidis]GJE33460.1 hypothetical protein LDDCCGHA_3660 [Methylobacterium oxalidis]GLS66193.1 hypothetical protein GCM10007888_45750 [Methylobacterium oxalidis]
MRSCLAHVQADLARMTRERTKAGAAAMDPLATEDEATEAKRQVEPLRSDDERLNTSTSRLEARLKEVLVEEEHEAFRPEFEATEREMAAAVQAFRENYPRLAGEIASMLSRLQAATLEAKRVNITAPAGWRRTVKGAETQLRGRAASYGSTRRQGTMAAWWT